MPSNLLRKRNRDVSVVAIAPCPTTDVEAVSAVVEHEREVFRRCWGLRREQEAGVVGESTDLLVPGAIHAQHRRRR